MSEPSLLVTTFTIPPACTHLLPCAALIEHLNQGSTLPLVLLSAGAGFGKTTLLAACLHQAWKQRVAASAHLTRSHTSAWKDYWSL